MTWNGKPQTRGHNYRHWQQLRTLVLNRDNHTCYICGQPGANQVDHITPTFEGGTDHPDNLAAIHANPCHQTKTNAEAARARTRHTTQRKPEPHPGLR